MKPAVGRDSFVHVRKRGAHGSLDEVNIGPLELNADGPIHMSIDNDVGRWQVDIAPIPVRLTVDLGDTRLTFDIIGIPGFVGVLAILAEEDVTPAERSLRLVMP